jgi:hypothetical protein
MHTVESKKNIRQRKYVELMKYFYSCLAIQMDCSDNDIFPSKGIHK